MLAFTFSDFLIFPSKDSIEPYFQTFREFETIIKTKLIQYIPTGCNALPAIRKNINLPLRNKNSFKTCFLGRHNKVKGYQFLKDIFPKLQSAIPNIEVIVGGKEGPIFRPNSENWTELGWIDEPRALLEKIDVFILPNERTYFDLVLLEALSIGKIVLISNTGGNKYFEDKSAGILVYKSESDFIEKLKSLSELQKRKTRNAESKY